MFYMDEAVPITVAVAASTTIGVAVVFAKISTTMLVKLCLYNISYAMVTATMLVIADTLLSLCHLLINIHYLLLFSVFRLHSHTHALLEVIFCCWVVPGSLIFII